MKVLHVVPEINEANGVYQVARDLARESGGEVIDARQFQSTNLNNRPIEQFSEVWVHGMWLPREWKACWKVLRNVRMFECSNVRPKLVRMTHGSLSPIYLEKQGKWKKRLVSPIERWLFKRTDRVVVTCEAEKKWCQEWGLKNRFEIVDLKRFFKFQVSGFRFQVSGFKFQVSGGRTLHVLYLGRRHPLKGVEFLERAVREIGLGRRSRSTVAVSTDGEMDRRVLALRKIDEWLQGVDAESFDAALERLVGERSASGEYRFKKEVERETAIAGARRFFVEFARKIIELSDGRCVYFAPDKRALERNRGDRARCWAEYAFHAVSSSGKIIDGRNYRERLFNSIKLDAMAGICEIISQEHCMYRLIDAVPQNDAVIFIGKDAFGGRTEVVTRLDEYGNAKANLGEVTVIVQHKRNKQTPPPKFRPLTEVVETVAKHQAAGFSPSTTVNSVANPIGPCKGAVREIGLGQRSRSTMDVELRIVSDHFGAELEKDWEWCDVLVLPTLSENFGLVVAEALERGKRVVTTDGAPAWGEGEMFECSESSNVRMGYGGRLVYLKGYRNGTDEERVRLLKEALEKVSGFKFQVSGAGIGG